MIPSDTPKRKQRTQTNSNFSRWELLNSLTIYQLTEQPHTAKEPRRMGKWFKFHDNSNYLNIFFKKKTNKCIIYHFQYFKFEDFSFTLLPDGITIHNVVEMFDVLTKFSRICCNRLFQSGRVIVATLARSLANRPIVSLCRWYMIIRNSSSITVNDEANLNGIQPKDNYCLD